MVERSAETPEEFGRRLAAETCAVFDRQRAEGERMVICLQNYGAAQRHAQATGGVGQDVLRMAWAAGDKPIELPRPKLVQSED